MNTTHSHLFTTQLFVSAFFVLALLTNGGLIHAQPVFASADPPAQQETAWLTPVPGFDIVKAFDKPSRNWHAGHRGIDVAALPGEPVRSPGQGEVRFAGAIAGKNVVSVVIDSYVVSFEEVDPAVKKGEKVFPGTPLGTVSNPSHCAQGCVHVGVWKLGSEKNYLNPADFFSAEASILLPDAQAPESLPPGEPDTGQKRGPGQWGGYENGKIPLPALCSLKTAPGHMLRCDAAKAFDRLSTKFKQKFGRYIAVTDSYRSYEQQVILKRRKGRMAATPGKSNHGWGLAVDLGSRINIFGSAEHTWLRQNGPAFGWNHPAWARQNGSLPEAWHWEYHGG